MQFQLTAGGSSLTGETVSVEHFPYVIGRDSTCDMKVARPGVFSRHAELRLADSGLVEIFATGDALVLVDDKAVNGYRLKNGERFRCGSAEFQFALAPGKLRKLASSEILFWLAAFLLIAGQLLIAFRM